MRGCAGKMSAFWSVFGLAKYRKRAAKRGPEWRKSENWAKRNAGRLTKARPALAKLFLGPF